MCFWLPTSLKSLVLANATSELLGQAAYVFRLVGNQKSCVIIVAFIYFSFLKHIDDFRLTIYDLPVANRLQIFSSQMVAKIYCRNKYLNLLSSELKCKCNISIDRMFVFWVTSYLFWFNWDIIPKYFSTRRLILH